MPLSRGFKNTVIGIAGTVGGAAALWIGAFAFDATTSKADSYIAKIAADQVPIAADPLYLKKVDFAQYTQAQVNQSNKTRLSDLNIKIAEIEGRLKYGKPTEAQRSQDEYQLKILYAERDDLTRELSQ